MKTGRWNGGAARALYAAALAMGALLLAEDASAIVGAPLTPMSYAGVARRTTRRAVAATAAAASIATLPAGCTPVGGIYGCGGTYYKPVYDGPNVVYVVTTPP